MKVVNFMTVFLKDGSKRITERCIQRAMKENLSFLKDLLELQKNKIFKHMAAVSKVSYFDILNDIVDKYSNTYHGAINKKPIDVKYNFYSEYSVESNEKDPEFTIGNNETISKYKNIFTSNWSEEVFVISKIKNTVSWTYIVNING